MTAKTENQHFSTIFKGVRKFFGLQQSEMASLLEVTQGWISKIESGSLLPDIVIWYKFTKKFFITDPYCFTYGGVEIKNDVLNEKLKTRSNLIKGQNFSKEVQFLSVRNIKPLINIFEKNYKRQFDDFLEENSIPYEFFVILNHPLSFELIDLIFNFMKEIKMNEKTFNHLTLDFNSIFNADEVIFDDQFFKEWKDNLEYNMKKGEYVVTFEKETFNKVRECSSSDLIIQYSLLFPYFYLKNTKQIKMKLPIIKATKRPGEWTVKYAA